MKGNHIENPGVLKVLKEEHIPKIITKCIIPDCVTRIGYSAFAYCESLKEITIPDSVTSIGDDVFWRCKSLTSIIIPDSITSISNGAFSYCYSLKEITIPDSVTSIGYSAFAYCESLKEVIFKGKTLDEVKQMKNYPFEINYPFGIKDESVFKFS